jgi:DNA-binding MarR family transcriptional regulator
MSEMLARLEVKGLIERRRHAEDGRARSVSLTRHGRRVQKTSWEVSASLRAELETLFPPDVMGSLVERLDRVAIAMSPPDGLEGRPARESGARRPKAAGR